MQHILIIDGPNLNLTGTREKQIYGAREQESPDSMEKKFLDRGYQVKISRFQSNHEGDIVDALHRAAAQGITGIVINPGAFTHTSISIADALRACGIPAVEVHLSHIYAREEFRRHNLTAPACSGSISGLGIEGYHLAVEYLMLQHS
ncbi:MAG TPA: type II 3-dehydroquinate dehydratase [Bacteroidales bacterium]|nr:type II 3-dehydroquinate dehydratase [Bacteroidales bacterium]HRZ50135.1 type II 3-dehydroquinate dehydratase [Bacteroidales bacterium]